MAPARARALVTCAGWLVACVGSTLAAGAPAAAAPPTQAGITVVHNVRYGTDVRPLRLDVYRPTQGDRHPVVLLIHGGGWIAGDKSQLAPVSMKLAGQGFVVFDINYRLAGTQVGYPAQVQDVKTAYGWVVKHADTYGGDPRRIGAFGTSAGAYLAAMLGTEWNAAGRQPPVRAVVSLSGPMNLLSLAAAGRRLPTCPPSTSPTMPPGPPTCVGPSSPGSTRIQAFLGCSIDTCPTSLLRQASPISHVGPQSPPFLLANSINEFIPASQAMGMATALQTAGVRADLRLVPGSGHGTEYGPQIAGQVLAFLQEHLGHVVPVSPTPSPTPVSQPPAHPHRAQRALILLAVLAVFVVGGVVALRRRRH